MVTSLSHCPILFSHIPAGRGYKPAESLFSWTSLVPELLSFSSLFLPLLYYFKLQLPIYSVNLGWAQRYTSHSSAAQNGLPNFFDIYKKLELFFFNLLGCKDFINMKSFLRDWVLQPVYGSDELEGSQWCSSAPSIIRPQNFSIG